MERQKKQKILKTYGMIQKYFRLDVLLGNQYLMIKIMLQWVLYFDVAMDQDHNPNLKNIKTSFLFIKTLFKLPDPVNSLSGMI